MAAKNGSKSAAKKSSATKTSATKSAAKTTSAKKTAATKSAAKTTAAPKRATRTQAAGRRKTPGYDFGNDPQSVSIPVNVLTYQYYRLLMENGALEGTIGNMRVMPELEPIFAAMHQVIAGGAVKIQLTRAGNADLVSQFEQAAQAAMVESNAVNKRANYYMTMTP